MPELILTVCNLTKRFGPYPVIEDLSFEIQQGERKALFAPSGAGKTTLINILSGLENHDQGSFYLSDSTPVTIFQEPRLFPFLTVEENIFLPFKAQGKSISDDTRRSYQAWLDVCDLGRYTRNYPYQLSGGLKQKTALIRGLLSRPRFAMLDEPFSSIDILSRQAIMEHILCTNPDLSLLFVTHQVDEITWLAQTVLYFRAPRLCQPVEIEAAIFQPLFTPISFSAVEMQHSAMGAPFCNIT
jgi:putative spermidine/putrescine transport system ATP-binding protein